MKDVLASPFTPTKADNPNGSNPSAPPSAPEMKRVTVTPELAQQWAEGNARNRPVRYARVARFARDMAAGTWTLNGQTILISDSGEIIDGQHRIYACIQAGKPFETFVVTGLPHAVQDTVDTGAARTMSDQFALRGEVNAPLLASVTRWAFVWLRGVRGAKGHGPGGAEPTHSEMLALLEAEPRLRDAAAWADHARKAFRSVNGTVYGMAWMLFHGSDHLAAEVFLEGVVTGADLPEGHPALAFRNRIWRAREAGERISPYEQLAYLIIAWNAFKEDRKILRLVGPRGGLTPKNFPEPK